MAIVVVATMVLFLVAIFVFVIAVTMFSLQLSFELGFSAFQHLQMSCFLDFFYETFTLLK